MGCCSCKDLTNTVWIDCHNDNANNQNNENNNITNEKANNNNTNENRQIEVNIINPEIKFNKNGSRIVNATSIQPIELKLDIQHQQTDEFEDMFNQII